MLSIEELNKEGWYVSKDGYDVISEDRTVIDKKTLISNALNTEIKDFGAPILTSEIKKNEIGKIILQIQKIRNISAPKNKEESLVAPRMLKLILTDGHTICQAIEVEKIPVLSRTDTAPGSKLLINKAKVSSSYILLYPNCCTLLGGKVPALYTKWELAKNVSQHLRTSVGIDGPPPWVSFGEKITSAATNEQFKSLTAKTSKETTKDFDVHRQDAIAVASTGAVKKFFGGGTKTIPLTDNPPFNRKNRSNYTQESKFKGKREGKESVEKLQKPAEKISLFDFLEDKLLVNDVDIKTNDNNIEKALPKSEPQKPRIENSSCNSDDLNSLTKNIGKMSVNSQFATKSFRQHLPLGNNKNNFSTKSTNQDRWYWKIGDLCMAKYWEDEKYYNAVIINLTERTCVVRFSDYGNVEEVLKVDCIPISEGNGEPNFNTNSNYKGSAKYRNNRRPYSNNRTYNKVQ